MSSFDRKNKNSTRFTQRDVIPQAIKFRLNDFFNAVDNTLTFYNASSEAFLVLDLETGEMTFKKESKFEGFAEADLSNISSFDIDFSGGDPDILAVRILDCKVATDNVGFSVTVSTDGGVTYKTADYFHGRHYFTFDGEFRAGSNSDSEIILAGDIGNASDERFNADVYLIRPFDTGYHKIIYGKTNHLAVDANIVSGEFAGYWSGGTDAINSLRFQADSGNIASCKVRAWVMSSI